MFKGIKRKLKEKNGAGTIDAVVIFLFAMLLLSVAYEYLRVQITANNIKDSYKRAILTVASENYNEVYAGGRELTYIGGEYEGGPEGGGDPDEEVEWVPMNDYGEVEEELKELLVLTSEESTLKSEKDHYELKDVQVQVRNAEAATNGRYEIIGTIIMRTPFYFSGIKVTEVELPLKVKTAYTPKY